MTNPFDTIDSRLSSIESLLLELRNGSTPGITPPEIIDRKELCKRLAITEPTVLRWQRKGKIPAMHIGSAVRYNWSAVVESLESKTKRRVV
jgi:excisionase family DNA binding protein